MYFYNVRTAFWLRLWKVLTVKIFWYSLSNSAYCWWEKAKIKIKLISGSDKVFSGSDKVFSGSDKVFRLRSRYFWLINHQFFWSDNSGYCFTGSIHFLAKGKCFSGKSREWGFTHHVAKLAKSDQGRFINDVHVLRLFYHFLTSRSYFSSR